MAAWEEAGKAAMVVESPESRWARDAEARGGDWQVKTTDQVQGLKNQVLEYDADGRLDREYLQRGGDVYYADGKTGLNDRVATVDEDGRNAREYADPETLVSAITGTKSTLGEVDTDGDGTPDATDTAPNDPAVQ